MRDAPDEPLQDYNPFDDYYRGEKPHRAFANLARVRKPEQVSTTVLEFINKWGLPGRTISKLSQVVIESERMYYHVRLLGLLKKIHNDEYRDHKVIGQIGTVFNRMGEKELLLVLNTESDAGRKLALRFEPNPSRGPEDQMVQFAQDYTSWAFVKFLRQVQPVLTFRKGQPVAQFLAPDLLWALYFMWYLDVTKGYQLKVCERMSCGSVFESTRNDRIYCSSNCAHAEATRAYRQKQKSQSIRRK